MKWYCVLLYEGDNLYAVFGRFKTRQEANNWRPRPAEEQAMRRQVVELFDPDSE